MVVDIMQCVASLLRGHVFYMGAKCNTLKCSYKDAYVLLVFTLFCPLWVAAFSHVRGLDLMHATPWRRHTLTSTPPAPPRFFIGRNYFVLLALPRCTKSINPGHTPLTIALSPLLFQREITPNGVIFKKRNKNQLSAKFYVCAKSGDVLFESQINAALELLQKAGDAREAHTSRRRSLVANFVGAANPVSTAVDTLVAVGSDSAAVSPISIEATREQARFADAGLSATASFYSGALSATLGASSGVTSDAAAETALSILSGRRAAAEEHAAALLSDSVRALQAPPGSVSLYFLYVFSMLSFSICFLRFIMSFF